MHFAKGFKLTLFSDQKINRYLQLFNRKNIQEGEFFAVEEECIQKPVNL
jgi:hypothetical protein